MKNEELVELMARAMHAHGYVDRFEDRPEFERAEYRAQARAALTALRSAGYAVVPRVATEGMALASRHTTPSTDWRDNIQRAWTAMIVEAEKVTPQPEG